MWQSTGQNTLSSCWNLGLCFLNIGTSKSKGVQGYSDFLPGRGHSAFVGIQAATPPHPTRQMVAFYWASGQDTQLISLCILTTCQLKWKAKAFGKKGMERKKSFKFRAKWCEAFPAWQEKCVYLVLKGIGPAVRETMTMTLSTVSPLEQKY